jgi:NADH:ubiquinone reductase (H+-translocating)
MNRNNARQRLEPDAPHVVIVGAGFAGCAAVDALAKAAVRVTLIDRNLYSAFQPLLYQVATGGLNPGDVAYPVGGFTVRRHARYIRGELASVDSPGRRIKLADGREFSYDYLILATGVAAAYFSVPGAAENTYGLYTRADAIVLRDHVMAGFERMSAAGGFSYDGGISLIGGASPNGRASEFAITVVGGGATGVELAGTLGELRGTVLRGTFPDVDPGRVHIRLVEMGPALLPPFHERLRDYAYRQLAVRGVDIRLNTEIREVRPCSVVLGDGQELASDLTVWAAGVAAPSAVAAWGLPQGKHGRLVVGEDLRIQGQDRIFAAGDIALNQDQPSPQLAQPALQEGKHAAAQVLKLIAGLSLEPFRYKDKGMMATIGRRSAVVDIPHGPQMTGTSAWLAWLSLHLMYLLGTRNRVSAMINLSWRYIAWGRGGGVIVGDEPPGANGQCQPDRANQGRQG